MNDEQLLRYSRHILLDDIGIEGQDRLRAAHAIVVGAGGLGSPAAIYLAAERHRPHHADRRRPRSTSPTCNDRSSTARPDVGMTKVASGAQALARLNPEVVVTTIARRIGALDLAALVPTADVRGRLQRQLRHAACRQSRLRHGTRTAGVGAAIRFDGQIASFDLRPTSSADRSPCYACLFPESDEVDSVDCATMGVFAPLTGIVGTMQAAEAAKIVIGLPSLSGRLVLLDARTMAWQSITLMRDPQCTVCGSAIDASPLEHLHERVDSVA